MNNLTEQEKDIIARYLLHKGKHYTDTLTASRVDGVVQRIYNELVLLDRIEAEELYQYYEQEWG